MSDQRSDTVSQAAQAMPSLAAVGLWLGGKDVNFWVGVAGLGFILLQAAYLIWKWSWQREVKRRQLTVLPDPDDE